MKAALISLFVFFGLIAVLGVGGYFYLANEKTQCEASGKAYVDESIPAIVSSWSKDELLKRVSPELRAPGSEDELDVMFRKLSGLGPMQSYDGSTGEVNIHVTKTAKMRITAHYISQATFQQGKAQIKTSLMQVDGVWQIQSFSVVPPAR